MSDMLLPLILFAGVGTFTPGPNNLMVTASGTAFGFARTIPHMLGITFGFALMVLAFGYGLAEVFRAFPDFHWWLRIVGAAYLLYLAYRLAQAGDPGAADAARRPVTFLEAALFQWVNPKAWTLALGVVTAFTTVGGNLTLELAVIVLVFVVLTLPSVAIWTLFGVGIRQVLSSPRTLRVVNLVMAALVALSVVMLFM